MDSNYQEKDYIEIDLLEVLKACKEKLLVIVLCGLIGLGGMAAYSFMLADPVYESTAKMYVLSQSTSITSLADIQLSSSLAQDYQEMITSRPVINQVRKNLGLAETYSQVVDMMTIENPSNTRVLNISVQYTDAEMAAAIANEVANIAKVTISDIMSTDAPKVFQKAIVSTDPVKPEKTKNMAIGFIIGALIACGFITIRVALDDKIKSPEDVEKILGYNVLANVPMENAERKNPDGRRRP